MFFKDRLLGLRKIAVLLHKVAAGKLPLIVTCVKLPASFLYNFLCETTLLPFRVPVFRLSQLPHRDNQGGLMATSESQWCCPQPLDVSSSGLNTICLVRLSRKQNLASYPSLTLRTFYDLSTFPTGYFLCQAEWLIVCTYICPLFQCIFCVTFSPELFEWTLTRSDHATLISV